MHVSVFVTCSVFYLHAVLGEQMKAEISCRIFVHPPPSEGPKPLRYEPLKRAATIASLVRILKISVTQIEVSPSVTHLCRVTFKEA